MPMSVGMTDLQDEAKVGRSRKAARSQAMNRDAVIARLRAHDRNG
jgi:hypothetical protein